jgi:hypothetical protein
MKLILNTDQSSNLCSSTLLRMEADAQLNRTTSDEQFLNALWKYQKSGVELNEETLIKEVIMTLQKGRHLC